MDTNKRELEEFVSIVLHNLRGPVVQISEFSKLLIEKLGPKATYDPDVQKNMGFIRSNSQKLKTMLGGIKAYSQVVKNKITHKNFDARPLLNEVSESLKPNDMGASKNWIHSQGNIR